MEVMKWLLTSVDDPNRLSDSLRNVGAHPLPEFIVHFLSLHKKGESERTEPHEADL